MQNNLEWSFLEIEEEEWQRRTDGQDSAAANCIPLFASRPLTDESGEERAPAAGAYRRRERRRTVWAIVASALVLIASMSYATWQAAQQGVARMRGDVANAVELATIKSHVEYPRWHEQAAVETVEFLDRNAMAQTVITHTLAPGNSAVQHQVLFYVQTVNGWQQTAPVAAFWGASGTLDTAHLHFIFRSRDRRAVEQLAPSAEALYVALQRATGQSAAADDGRLTVEVVPMHPMKYVVVEKGHISLPSPFLFAGGFGMTPDELFGSLLREALATEMVNSAKLHAGVMPQWQPMAEGVRLWLQYSDDLPLAPPKNAVPYWLRATESSLHLQDLLGCAGCAATGAESIRNANLPWSTYDQDWLAANAAILVDYLAASQGLNVLPKLLQGLGTYDDWQTLAPAVAGVGPAQLDTAWHSAMASVTVGFHD